jgi:hypothetical protein
MIAVLTFLGTAIVAAFTYLGAVTTTLKAAREQAAIHNRSDRIQVYSQLNGQKGVLLALGQAMIFAEDKARFYGLRAAQANQKVTVVPRGLAGYKDMFDDEAVQQERLFEHYRDQQILCTQKLLESLAVIHLVYPSDPEIDRLSKRVEDTADYPYQPPDASKMIGPDATDYLEMRRRQTEFRMKALYGRPIEDLLRYLDRYTDKEAH